MGFRRRRRGRLVRSVVRLGVLGGAVVGARRYRDRAVAANTLRDDHVLDFTKPFLGGATAPPDPR